MGEIVVKGEKREKHCKKFVSSHNPCNWGQFAKYYEIANNPYYRALLIKI
jgi:hypothetical protein